MAVGKLQGVETVEVSLKRAAAEIRLRPGNVVTLSELRRIIKDNGFSSRETTATAVGKLIDRGGSPALALSGLNALWSIVRDPKQPKAYDDVLASLKAKQALAVEVVGVVPANSNAQQPDHIVVTSVRALAPQ